MSITQAPTCDKVLRDFIGSPQIENARRRLHASERERVQQAEERSKITDLLEEKEWLLTSLEGEISQIEDTEQQIEAISALDPPLFMANKQYLDETIEMQKQVIENQIESNERQMLEDLKNSLNCPLVSSSQGAADELLQSQNVGTDDLTRTERELALSASENTKELIEFQAAIVNNLKLTSAITGTTLSTRSSLHGSKVFLSNDQIQEENEAMEQAIAELRGKKAAQDQKNGELRSEIEVEKGRLSDAQKYCESMKETIDEFKKQISQSQLIGSKSAE